MKRAIVAGAPGFTPVQDRFFKIKKMERRRYGASRYFFHLGMSVSAYGSIRVPRVGSTS